MTRRSLLLVAFLLALVSLALSVTGGVVTTLMGLRVSARSPLASAIAAAGAIVWWALLARRAKALGDDLVQVDAWVSTQASAVVLTVAGIGGAVAVYYGTFSAAGSDASGYLSHAFMLTQGALEHREPLMAVADWPGAEPMVVPLGWHTALEPFVQAPSYPIGLPLIMLPLYSVGGTIAACLIVPLSFVMAVWAAGALAHRIAGPMAAIVGAVWLATSPIALVQAMQPMTDVPVTAAWLGCWLLIASAGYVARDFSPAIRSVAGGLAAAAAVLIRPNLAPLAAIPALWVLRRSAPAFFAFSAPVALAGLLIASLHWRWFGSPLRSGHGTAEDFFSLAYIMPNAGVYTRWLLDTHGPWLLAAPLAWVWPGGRLLRWLLAFAAAVVVAYLIFGVFEVWLYLRFLLPALAVAMIAVASIVATLVARLPMPARTPVVAIVTLAIATANVTSAQSHGVFRAAGIESRAALTGRYLDSAMPASAVALAGEQSGSVRYYTRRSIVRWDLATPETLDLIIARLESRGDEIWIVLDAWEEELFRRRFPNSPAGALDWPPRVEAGTQTITRAWRLRDREAFRRGERLITDRLR